MQGLTPAIGVEGLNTALGSQGLNGALSGGELDGALWKLGEALNLIGGYGGLESEAFSMLNLCFCTQCKLSKLPYCLRGLFGLRLKDSTKIDQHQGDTHPLPSFPKRALQEIIYSLKLNLTVV